MIPLLIGGAAAIAAAAVAKVLSDNSSSSSSPSAADVERDLERIRARKAEEVRQKDLSQFIDRLVDNFASTHAVPSALKPKLKKRIVHESGAKLDDSYNVGSLGIGDVKLSPFVNILNTSSEIKYLKSFFCESGRYRLHESTIKNLITETESLINLRDQLWGLNERFE